MPTLYEKGLSEELIFKALVEPVYKKAFNIAEGIKQVLDPVVDDFFRTIADDIYELMVGEDDGLVVTSYQPLTAKYIQAKGNAYFWLYTRTRVPAAIRKARKIKLKRLSLKKDDGDLITTFKKLSGIKMLGGVDVIVYDGLFGNSHVVTRQKSKSDIIENFTQTYYSKYRGKRIRDLKFSIKLGLWENLQGNLEQPEDILFKAKMNQTYRKLMNRLGEQRPLIVPYLYFYTKVVLPNILEEYLANYPGTKKLTLELQGLSK